MSEILRKLVINISANYVNCTEDLDLDKILFLVTDFIFKRKKVSKYGIDFPRKMIEFDDNDFIKVIYHRFFLLKFKNFFLFKLTETEKIDIINIEKESDIDLCSLSVEIQGFLKNKYYFEFSF